MEAPQPDEMSPDAYALAEVIKEISPLLQGSLDMYSDMRQKLVDRLLNKSKLSFETSTIADIPPDIRSYDSNFDKVSQALTLLKAQLRQLEVERKGSIAASANALEQYKSENERLYQKLSEYRMKEAMETDSTSAYSKSMTSLQASDLL